MRCRFPGIALALGMMLVTSLVATGCSSAGTCYLREVPAESYPFLMETETADDTTKEYRIYGLYREAFELSELIPYYDGSIDDDGSIEEERSLPDGYCVKVVPQCRKSFHKSVKRISAYDRRYVRLGRIDAIVKYLGGSNLHCPIGYIEIVKIVKSK